jgi:riboflavin synthase
VWFIPETLRLTTFGARDLGSSINLEIERSTQVTVDTIRDFLEERLGPLLPRLESLVGELGDPHPSPLPGGRGDKREE